MRRTRLSAVGVAVVVACGVMIAGPVGTASAAPLPITTFGCTGRPASFTVSPGVRLVTVVAEGAQGGPGQGAEIGLEGDPGLGGRITALVVVQPGEVLEVHVGCAGQELRAGRGGGYGYGSGGDGGAASEGEVQGGGGGGASAVVGHAGRTKFKLVAGGGGGGGASGSDNGGERGHGGHGGAGGRHPTSGTDAVRDPNSGSPAVGKGGRGGARNSTSGGEGQAAVGSFVYTGGGGGGGGCRGGNGGTTAPNGPPRYDNDNGGGGSSCFSGPTVPWYADGVNSGDGSVTISTIATPLS